MGRLASSVASTSKHLRRPDHPRRTPPDLRATRHARRALRDRCEHRPGAQRATSVPSSPPPPLPGVPPSRFTTSAAGSKAPRRRASTTTTSSLGNARRPSQPAADTGVCAPVLSTVRPHSRLRRHPQRSAVALNEADEEHRHPVDPYMTCSAASTASASPVAASTGRRRRLHLLSASNATTGWACPTQHEPGGTQELTSRIGRARSPPRPARCRSPNRPRRDRRQVARLPARCRARHQHGVRGVDVNGLASWSSPVNQATAGISRPAAESADHTRLRGNRAHLYLPSRPRHYEHLEHYHAVFYCYVEALSVTLFASCALTRSSRRTRLLVRLDGGGIQPQPRSRGTKGAGQFASSPCLPASSRRTLTKSTEIEQHGAPPPTRRVGRGQRPEPKARSQPRKKDDVTVPLLQAPARILGPVQRPRCRGRPASSSSARRARQRPGWRFGKLVDADGEEGLVSTFDVRAGPCGRAKPCGATAPAPRSTYPASP